MALGAILGAALTDHSARSKGLYVGGVDVIDQPGSSGNLFGVPLETIEVTEAGPNGVSSMTFVIDDPNLAITVSDGMDVRYQDFTLNATTFYGFVQVWNIEPAFGDTGRQIKVTAVGVETVLDWGVLGTTIVFPALTGLTDAVQSVVANSIGLGPIRAFSNSSAGFGDQANPIQFLGGSLNTAALTVTAGTTVREAIRQLWTWILAPGYLTANVTVDFYYGLRLWLSQYGFAFQPDDYTTETLVNTGASAANTEALEYETSAGDIVRGVFVRGTGISGTVSDGTGKMGEIATLDDASITTAAGVIAAGIAYLQAFNAGVRGRYQRTDWTPVATIHAGGYVRITDARADLSAVDFRIMEIRKTFNPSTRENWTVTFGGLPPSGANLMRRLTRDTLS